MSVLFRCLKSHVDRAEKRKKNATVPTANVQSETKDIITSLRAKLSLMSNLDPIPECGPSQPAYVSPRRTKYKQDILAAAGYEAQRPIVESTVISP